MGGDGPWQSHGFSAYLDCLLNLLQFSEGWLQYSGIFQASTVTTNQSP